MEFNDLIDGLGHFGRFQKQQYFLMALLLLSISMQLLGNVFILAIPKHRCAVPGLANDTYQIQDELHAKLVELSIPMTSSSFGGLEYSKCEVYSKVLQPKHDSTIRPSGLEKLADGPLEELLHSSAPQINGTDRENTTQSCSRWVFDKSVFSLTASSQFGLVCGRELVRSHLVMALMSGQMVGALFTGPLTDQFGRKTSLVAALAFHLLVSVATAFALQVYVLAALYFLNGAIITCIGCSSYTLAMELVGPRWRHVAGIMIFYFWTLGMALLALLAYLVRDWTRLQLAISCPIVLYLSYYFLVKESVRWLHSKGRFEQTKKILEGAAATNGVKLDIDSIHGLEIHAQVQSESLLAVFRHLSLIGRLVIVCINWFVCSLTYYGLSLNVGTLSGNIFLNFALSALFELLAYTALSLSLLKVGRKTIYCGSIILAGSACLLTVFPVLYGDGSTLWTVRMLANIGKFGISAAFGLAWMFTSELFPTSVRASVMAAGSFFARVGAVSASYIAFLGQDGELQRVMPQIVFGTGGLVVGFLAMMLPETRDRHLPQTVKDATQMEDLSAVRKVEDKDGASTSAKPLITHDVSL